MTKISKSGYKRNSKDKKEKSLIIPSNNITMNGVDFPVLGTDNYGNSQMMYPGMDYNFPGEYVYEVPMARYGGDPSIPDLSEGWLSKYQTAGQVEGPKVIQSGNGFEYGYSGDNVMMRPIGQKEWTTIPADKVAAVKNLMPGLDFDVNKLTPDFQAWKKQAYAELEQKNQEEIKAKRAETIQRNKFKTNPGSEKVLPPPVPITNRYEGMVSSEEQLPAPVSITNRYPGMVTPPSSGPLKEKPYLGPDPIKAPSGFTFEDPAKKKLVKGNTKDRVITYNQEYKDFVYSKGDGTYDPSNQIPFLGPESDEDNFLSTLGDYAQYWYEKEFGVSSAAESELETFEEQPVNVNNESDLVNTPTSSPYKWKSGKAQILAKDSDVDYGNPHVKFWAFKRTAFNDEGMVYIPTPRKENWKGKGIDKTAGMAHFLIKSDLTDGHKDPETTNSIKKSIANNQYLPIYKKEQDGKVRLKYIKGSESLEEGWDYVAALRQEPLSNINWSSSARPYHDGPSAKRDNYKRTGKGMFGEGISNVLTKDGKDTWLVYKDANGRGGKLGRFNGNSLVFIIEKNGERIIRDFTGTVEAIEKESINLLDEFGVTENDVTLAFYDQGSYTAKPKADKNGFIPYKNYNGFNKDDTSGAGLAIPFEDLESMDNFKMGGWLHKYQTAGPVKPTSNFTLPSLDPQAQQAADYNKGWEAYNAGVRTWTELLQEKEEGKGRPLTTEEKQAWLQKAVKRNDGRKTEIDPNDPKWNFLFKDSYQTWDPEFGPMTVMNKPIEVTYQMTDLDKEKARIATETRKGEMTPFAKSLGMKETDPNVQKRASQNANDQVALRILNDKPQGDRNRVDWLNTLTPEERSTIERSQYAGKLEPDYTSQFSQGVENIARRYTIPGQLFSNGPLWTNPDYTPEEAATASPMGVLAPLNYPANLMTGAITGDFGSALQGQTSMPLFTDYRQPEFAATMSGLAESIYDPAEFLGGIGLLKGAANIAGDIARGNKYIGSKLPTVPTPWSIQELSGLHLKSTMSDGPISKIVEPKTGLINVEQALGIIGKESSGADKVALIKQSLGETLPKKMDYNDFRKLVQDQLIPLERQFTTRRSHYGIENLGYIPLRRGSTPTERYQNLMITPINSLFKKPELLENQTLILGNKSKFGRGSSAHGNPDETLGHIHFLRTSETPDVLTVTQIQSDAFQGTHRIMPKTQQEALEKVNKLKEEGEYIKSIYGDGRESSNSVLANYEKHFQLDDASAKNFTQKSLLDKNHQERYLQELVNYAGERGDVNKIRLPTSETAAKVQNYKKITNETIGPITKKQLDESSTFEEFIKAKSDEFAERNYTLNETNLSELRKIFNEYKSGTLTGRYEPEHQTILKKYSEQPKTIKKLFGVEPRIVTDNKGNTWYEFDIPEGFKGQKGEIKAYKYGGWLEKYQTKGQVNSELSKFMKAPMDPNDLRYIGNQQAVADNTRVVVPKVQTAKKDAPAAVAEIQRVNAEMQKRGVKTPKEVYAQEKTEAQQAAAIEAATNDKLYVDNQSAFDKAMYKAYNVVSNPLDALGHYNKYGYIQQGNQGNYGLRDDASPMGAAVNAANPFAWLNAGIRLQDDLGKPETYTTWSGAGNALMDALEMLPMFTETRPLAGAAMLADDAARAGKYLTTKTPLKNAYNLRSSVLKENPEMYLYRARPVGQNVDMNMAAQLRAKEAAGEPLTWYQRNLLNPQTNAQMLAREKYFGRFFEKDPNRLDWYINPETRNFADNEAIEILRTKLPKSEAAKLNVSHFDDAKVLSSSPKTEFILPKNMINSAERFPESSWQQLIQEDQVFNTPHWWRGYGSKTPKQLPISPKSINPKKLGSSDILASRILSGPVNHLEGLIAGTRELLFDPQKLNRSFSEVFPLSKAAQTKAQLESKLANEAANEFVKNWIYRDSDLYPGSKFIREDVDDKILNIMYDGKNPTTQFPNYSYYSDIVPSNFGFGIAKGDNPLMYVPNITVNTRYKNLKNNSALNQEDIERILKNRATTLGVNYSSDNFNPKSYTYENQGLYNIPYLDKFYTGIHEQTHTMQNFGTYENVSTGKGFGEMLAKYEDKYGYYVPNEDTEIGRKFAAAMRTPKVKKNNWYSSPNELHSELMIARQKLHQTYLDAGMDYEDAMMLVKEGSDDQLDWMIENQNLNNFFKKSTTQETKRELLRILPVAIPAAIGTGAAAVIAGQDTPQQKYGGWLNKYQAGGSSDYDKIPQSWKDTYDWTPNVEAEYQAFKNDPTGPSNLAGTDDMNDYNTRGMWDSLDRPADWKQGLDLYKQQWGEEWTPEEDGYYHAWSQHPGTGEWLKPKHHDTAWMNYGSYIYDPNNMAVVNPEGFFGNETLQSYPKEVKYPDGGGVFNNSINKKHNLKTSAEGYYAYINGVTLSKGGSPKSWLDKYK